MGLMTFLFVCFLIRFRVLKGEILENFASLGEDSLWWERVEERVFAKFRDGSRWNSNQGLELGADVLWCLFLGD